MYRTLHRACLRCERVEVLRPYTHTYQNREPVTGGRGFDLIVLHYENALPGRVASLVARFESRSGNDGAGVRQTGEVIHTISLVVWHRVAVERGLEETEEKTEREREKEQKGERERTISRTEREMEREREESKRDQSRRETGGERV